MFKTVQFKKDTGESVSLFLFDTETGNTAKDILTVPGLYDSTVSSNNGATLYLELLSGGINGYHTKLYGLTVGTSVGEDMTQLLNQALMVPATAVSTLLSSYSEDIRDSVSTALNTIHYYEGIKSSDKLCLSGEAFSKLPSDIASKMASVRKSYILKGTDNQEIFQKTSEESFGVVLPSLEEIHSGEDAISSLDLLRVLMPYRKQEGAKRFVYRSIYHTPYYKVDPALNGMVPKDMEWLSGYSSNDTLETQINEQHMVNNLNLFICSDISRYVTEMVSGIFLDTDLGSTLARLCVKRDLDLMHYLLNELKDKNSDDASCNIITSDMDELYQNDWVVTEVVSVIKSNLTIRPEYLTRLIQERPVDRRTIECDNLPFTITLTDSQEQEFTDLLISMGYISSAMQRFLVLLCKCAYSVNWGHTGATLAIPGFVIKSQLSNIDAQIVKYLADKTSNDYTNPNNYPALYLQDVDTDDDDDFIVDSSSPKEDTFSRFNYYITSDTARRINNDTLPYDYFSTQTGIAQTTEAAIVEYWRNTNGSNNLDVFLSSAYLQTADTGIFIDSFIKLSRWGARKPKLLVFPNHPEIRKVFDLNSGMQTDNYVVIDEKELVKVNGCDYTLGGFLTSDSNSNLKDNKIVGFILVKTYGEVQKYFLASWVDLGEIASNNEKVIGDFMTMGQVTLSEENTVSIEKFSKMYCDFYISDSNIETGLRMKIQPKDLSTIALLPIEGVLDSMGYLRSLKNDRIITTKDRQYEILHRYVDTLNKFYMQHGDEVRNISTTIDLSSLAVTFYEMYSSKEAKKDVNAKISSNTLSMLNLDGVENKPSIEWDDTELIGKFYIIADMEMHSSLPPIEFTDKQLQGLAAKARNRVIMLMLQKDGKYIFCRKDIGRSEVMLLSGKNADGQVVKKIAFRAYKDLECLMNDLFDGKKPAIRGVPAVLHRSLEEFVI